MLARLRKHARKIARLDARSVADVFAAQVALLRARHLVRTQPIGSLTVRSGGKDPSRDGSAQDAPTQGDATRADVARADALALAVSRAADYGLFRPFCLVRALALRTLLERHGLPGSKIRIGVRTREGKFSAHAWIVWNDRVLGDDPKHVATFTEVDDIRVLGAR